MAVSLELDPSKKPLRRGGVGWRGAGGVWRGQGNWGGARGDFAGQHANTGRNCAERLAQDRTEAGAGLGGAQGAFAEAGLGTGGLGLLLGVGVV